MYFRILFVLNLAGVSGINSVNMDIDKSLINGLLMNYGMYQFIIHLIIQLIYYIYVSTVFYYWIYMERYILGILIINSPYILHTIYHQSLSYRKVKKKKNKELAILALIMILIYHCIIIWTYYPLQIMMLLLNVAEYYNFHKYTTFVRNYLTMVYGEQIVFKHPLQLPMIVWLVKVEDYITGVDRNNINPYSFLKFVHYVLFIAQHWTYTGQPTDKHSIESELTQILNDEHPIIPEECHKLMASIKHIMGNHGEIICKGGTSAIFGNRFISSEEWSYTDFDCNFHITRTLSNEQIYHIQCVIEQFIYKIYKLLPKTLVIGNKKYHKAYKQLTTEPDPNHQIIEAKNGKRIRRIQYFFNGGSIIRFGPKIFCNLYCNEFLSVPNDVEGSWRWNNFHLFRFKGVYIDNEENKVYPEILDASINSPFSCKYINKAQLPHTKCYITKDYIRRDGVLYPRLNKTIHDINRMLQCARKLLESKITKYNKRLIILKRELLRIKNIGLINYYFG